MTDFTFTNEVPGQLQEALRPRLQGWIDDGLYPQFDLRLRGRIVTFVRNPWPASGTTFVSLLSRADFRSLMQRRSIGSPPL
jgi:hypothetical protein